jgi:hypothetical protein
MFMRSVLKTVAALSMFASASLFAAPLVVNVAGAQSYGEFGDAGNTVLTYNVGANATITSVAFNVNVTAFSPSWLYELSVALSDSAIFEGTVVYPTDGDQFPGTASYSTTIDLISEGSSFVVGADGVLRIEFFEDFDDLAGADGVWNFGTLTIGVESADVPPTGDVPEPSSVLLLGAGLAALGYTSRRRAKARASV